MAENLHLQKINETLDLLAKAAAKSIHSIALLGAGSVGAELARVDQFSDIDFFLIVDEGFSAEFINDNSWFGQELPIAFQFRDTQHGNKVLLENGVFLEFAIFTEVELAENGIPGLRKLWSRPQFSVPDLSSKQPQVRELSYYVDEALSNLLVGALRLRRGERLAALSMIERYALTNFLIAYRVKNHIGIEDPFNIERRAETSLGLDFAKFLNGYEKLELSLTNILNFAEENFQLNFPMTQLIRDLTTE